MKQVSITFDDRGILINDFGDCKTPNEVRKLAREQLQKKLPIRWIAPDDTEIILLDPDAKVLVNVIERGEHSRSETD